MRRAWVEIDLGALLRNGTRVRSRAGVPILPMVKGDAYGLGAVRVARALERLDPWGFGVATVREGEILREHGIRRPILVFTPLLVDEFDALERFDLTPTLGTTEAIHAWGPRRRPWHLAIDTGMNRAGVQWTEIGSLLDAIRPHPPQGAYTHFHSAASSPQSREEQEQRFRDALARLPERPAILHAENSPAVEHRAPSPWDVVRPGVFLYGVTSGHEPAIRPDPVVTVCARIVDLRDVADGETVSYEATWRATGRRRIATLGIGYADGYRRALSNRGAVVVVNGQRAPVAGIVTMDMTMIDVTDVSCAVGDVATLIGEGMTVNDVAAVAEMSPYELLTGLVARLPRRYSGDGTVE